MTELISIAAVLLSPLVALEVSEWLQRRRERLERRRRVFATLMSTRASGLAPEHVQALNMIDVEFHGGDAKSQAVLAAWKAYLDHLSTNREANAALWDQRKEDLLVELLYQMAVHLGYEFDKTHIRRAAYFPIGYGDLQADQLVIRKAMVAILKGEASFPILVSAIKQEPPTPGGAPQVGPG